MEYGPSARPKWTPTFNGFKSDMDGVIVLTKYAAVAILADQHLQH